MRTTLDIEDDVLQAAKELASSEKSTAGKILSRLAREAMFRTTSRVARRPTTRNGVPIFPARSGEIVTLEKVQKLIEEEGV